MNILGFMPAIGTSFVKEWSIMIWLTTLTDIMKFISLDFNLLVFTRPPFPSAFSLSCLIVKAALICYFGGDECVQGRRWYHIESVSDICDLVYDGSLAVDGLSYIGMFERRLESISLAVISTYDSMINKELLCEMVEACHNLVRHLQSFESAVPEPSFMELLNDA